MERGYFWNDFFCLVRGLFRLEGLGFGVGIRVEGYGLGIILIGVVFVKDSVRWVCISLYR